MSSLPFGEIRDTGRMPTAINVKKNSFSHEFVTSSSDEEDTLSDFAVFWNLSASFSRLLLNSSHEWNQNHIEEVLFNAGPALGF